MASSRPDQKDFIWPKHNKREVALQRFLSYCVWKPLTLSVFFLKKETPCERAGNGYNDCATALDPGLYCEPEIPSGLFDILEYLGL